MGAAQYRAIASFRHQLRRFLAFSEAAAAEVGLPSQQHQVLLAVAGHAEPEPPSVGFIAEHLVIAPHTAAELVARMVSAGLIKKTPSQVDRRRMELTLTSKATSLLARLTDAHLEELEKLYRLLSEAVSPPPTG